MSLLVCVSVLVSVCSCVCDCVYLCLCACDCVCVCDCICVCVLGGHVDAIMQAYSMGQDVELRYSGFARGWKFMIT